MAERDCSGHEVQEVYGEHCEKKPGLDPVRPDKISEEGFPVCPDESEIQDWQRYVKNLSENGSVLLSLKSLILKEFRHLLW